MNQRIPIVVLGLLAVTLIAFATPQRVGDGGEYMAMGYGLAEFHHPALTPDELRTVEARIGQHGPQFEVKLSNPSLVGADGRQDFMHFWLFSALASPLVALARILRVHTHYAFACVNVVLWLVAARASKLPAALTLFVFASPIVWWLDKAHPDTLIFAAEAFAFSRLTDAPHLASLSLAGAAAQNPSLSPLLAVPVLCALGRRQPARIVALCVLFAMLALVDPIYYLWHLGRTSPLLSATTNQWPPWERLTATLIDPNIGLFPAFPQLMIPLLAGTAVWFKRRTRWRPDVETIVVVVAIGVEMFVFSQTPNMNSGGTPGMARYAIWMLPMMIPLLVRASGAWGSSRLVLVAVIASAAWCTYQFYPARPEGQGTPTWLADAQWHHLPGLHNPVPEIFAERTSGGEPGTLPASASCTKILFTGDLWPRNCSRVPVPAMCKESLCYANATGSGDYNFVQMTSPPHPFVILQ